jgi:hypothetical protein
MQRLEQGHRDRFCFTLFLASGGLGYLFSVIHHRLHWWWNHKWFAAIDHTQVVRQLSKAGLLELYKLDDGEPKKLDESEVANINREKAWLIVTAVWKQDDSRIKSADACSMGLMDLTHSAGAARVGALFALGLVAVLLFWRVPGLSPSCFWKPVAIVVGLALVLLHHRNYIRVGTLAQRFINEVLSDALWVKKNPSPTSPQEPKPPTAVTFVEL